MENNLLKKGSKIFDVFDLYKFVKTKYKYTSILESLGQYDENRGRYTIIGVIVSKMLFMIDSKCFIQDVFTGIKSEVDFLETLDEFIHISDKCDSEVVQTGSIGYVDYAQKHLFERLDIKSYKDIAIPEVALAKYDLMFFLDRKESLGYWVFENESFEKIVENIELEFNSFTKSKNALVDKFSCGPVNMDFNYDEYIRKIEKTIEYIRDGDIFQANITERFSAEYAGDAFVLYETLREKTPNPFFAYFDFDYPFISTSPERFFRLSGNEIITNPIKGTVRCEINGIDQKEILLNCEKNRAENTMIVDLMRNDIGRICRQGTVEVTSLCEIHKFNLLYHLESVVKGTLKSNIKFSDILKALYPGGSITGAPKIRAMEIIEELETKNRGPYTGAIGFFGVNGYVDTAIAIRIIYFDEKKLYLHAGGGIVVDSEPEHEFLELMLKVESIKSSLSKFEMSNMSDITDTTGKQKFVNTINKYDKASLYGFGLFETFYVDNESKIFLLNKHIERMLNSAKHFRINHRYNQTEIFEEIMNYVKIYSIKNKIIRMTLNAGNEECGEIPTITYTQRKYSYSKEMIEKGVKLMTSSVIKCPDSLIIRHKTSNYLENLMVMQDAKSQGFDDALFVNTNGDVTETTKANIFFVEKEILHTPMAKCGFLEGIMREYIIYTAKKNGIEIVEGNFSVSQVKSAKEAFICNSVLGITHIQSIDGDLINEGCAGQFTKRFIDILNMKHHI